MKQNRYWKTWLGVILIFAMVACEGNHRNSSEIINPGQMDLLKYGVDAKGNYFVKSQIVVKLKGSLNKKKARVRFEKKHKIKSQKKLFKGLKKRTAMRLKRSKNLRTKYKQRRRFKRFKGVAATENIYLFTVPADTDMEAALKRFRSNPDVVYAHPNYVISAAASTPNDPYFSSAGAWGQSYDDLWGVKRIGGPAAWDVTRGDGVIVAVVDSGLDVGHPDIMTNVWTNPGEIPDNGIDDDGNGYIDDVHGWDFDENDNDPSDFHGHGTHVAGTIGAIGDNGLGVIGVAPGVKIMPIKGLGATGTGNLVNLVEGMIYAAENGASVINCSWGGLNIGLLEETVIALSELDTVMVFAAGNGGISDPAGSPQNMHEVITVSATDASDQLADFSHYGPVIDVSAPGVDILSLNANAGDNFMADNKPPEETIGGGLYLLSKGTSMAAPHVAGVAALVRAHRPAFSAKDVKQAIQMSAEDLGDAGRDDKFGHGLVRADLALAIDQVMQVNISSPTRILEVGPNAAAVDVFGQASGPGFQSYSLYTADVYGEWQLLTSNSTATSGTDVKLGTWNLSGKEIGNYYLKLEITATGGKLYEDTVMVRYRNAPDANVTDLNHWTFLESLDKNHLAYVDGQIAAQSFVEFGIVGDVYVKDLFTNKKVKVSTTSSDSVWKTGVEVSNGHLLWSEMAFGNTSKSYHSYNIATKETKSYVVSNAPWNYSFNFAALNDGRVLLAKKISSSWELVVYDFATQLETQITTGANVSAFTQMFDGYKAPFHVEGDQVVYVTTAGELYYLRLSNPTPQLITANAGSGASARISEGRIAWVQKSGDVGSLYVYDIASASTELRLSADKMGTSIDFDGDVVAFVKMITTPIADANAIYAYNLATSEEEQIAVLPDNHLQVPQVNGRVIAWSVMSNYNLNYADMRIQYKEQPWADQAGVVVEWFNHDEYSKTVANGPTTGRYVKVQLPVDTWLSLAEVEILNAAGTNLALSGTAMQSSTWTGNAIFGADKAIDGNTSGNIADGSLTFTDYGARNWWIVDLGSNVAIDKINVHNGYSNTTDRLNGATVEIIPEQVTVNWFNHLEYITTSATGPRTGRYVKVKLPAGTWLSLAEVEVLDHSGNNLALSGVPTQSSTRMNSAGFAAGLAIDGNTSGSLQDLSFTLTEWGENNWWMIDLGSNVLIDSINVYNGMENTRERLNGALVEILPE